jgi:hypothetical protein
MLVNCWETRERDALMASSVYVVPDLVELGEVYDVLNYCVWGLGVPDGG